MAGGSMYFFPGWRILGVMVRAWVAAQDVHRGEPLGIPFPPSNLLLFLYGKDGKWRSELPVGQRPCGGMQSRLGEACWTTLPLLLPIHTRPTLGLRAVSKRAVWTVE